MRELKEKKLGDQASDVILKLYACSYFSSYFIKIKKRDNFHLLVMETLIIRRWSNSFVKKQLNTKFIPPFIAILYLAFFLSFFHIFQFMFKNLVLQLH